MSLLDADVVIGNVVIFVLLWLLSELLDTPLREEE